MNKIKDLLQKLSFILLCIAILYSVGQLMGESLPFKITSLLGKDHPVRLEYQQFQAKFNEANRFLMAVEKKDLSAFQSEETYQISQEVEILLERIHGVKKVSTPKNAEFLIKNSRQYYFSPIFDKKSKLIKAEALLDLKRPFFEGSLFSSDRKYFLINVELKKNVKDKLEKTTLSEVFQLLDDYKSEYKKINIHLIGPKIAEYHFLQDMLRNQNIITPLLLLLLAIFIYFLFRQFSILAWFFTILMVSYVLIMIIILLIEGGFTPFSGLVLTYTLIIATSDLIHFFTVYQRASGDLKTRIQFVRNKILVPCFLTSLTTMIGFFSLYLNDLVQIKLFGLYCTLSSLLSFLMTFYLLPLGLKIFKHKSTEYKGKFIPMEKLYAFIVNRRKSIIVSFVLLSLTMGYFSRNLQVSDNVYDKFVKGHPLSNALNVFDNNFHFVGGIDVVVDMEGQFPSIDLLTQVEKLEEQIAAHPKVFKVQSFNKLYKYVLAKTGDFPSATENTLSFLRSLSYYHLLDGFILRNHKKYKITVLMNKISSSDVNQVVADIEPLFPKELDISIQGFSKIRSYIYNGILKNLVKSFIFSYLIIFLIFFLIFKNIKWALIAMIPNTLPVLFMVGLMGLFDLKVESTLVMLICITIGVSVDDTIHFLYVVKKRIKEGAQLSNAILDSYRETGKALIGTTTVIVLTFPCLMIGEMKIIFQMGIFIMLSLIFALLADFILLPALLLKETSQKEI